MAAQAAPSKLLFYDVIRHEDDMRDRMDTIRFKTPVVVREFRIVPPNKIPHPNVPLPGKTRPQAFSFELFARNLRNPQVRLYEARGPS
jgi:hypothetical protein